MAAKFTTTSGEKFSRQDTFRVNPDDVLTGEDSRILPAPDQDDLDRRRAVSLLTEGQLQPIPVRKDDEGRLVTIAGNTRHRAAKLIRSGFTYGEIARPPVPDFQLWVAVQKMTADEAFDAGVAENHERNDATDLQEALAQNVYRTKRGLNDTEIAQKYGYTNTNRVAKLKKLLARPELIKQAVHAGKLSLEAAIDTEKLTEEKLSAFVEKIEAGEKVNGAEVRNAGRTEETVVKRNVKNFKDFVADLKNVTDEDCPPSKKALFEKLEDWFAGKCGDKALWNAIDKA